ncbi:MAG: protein translocase subunit SecD [Candidatus Sungbacteria bacterium]|nr:protein translocase subunit SecD [Candidatus Sungbacteria bacterium]
MALPAPKKRLTLKTARLLAVFFLILGITLGIFDAPHIADKALGALRFGKLSDFKLTDSRLHIPYRLGLDIQGGTHLVYRADVANIPSGEQADSLNGVRDVIERRVNLFGVSEPLVQVERAGKDWRLIVELAGVRDINTAINLIGQTPFLEFREERSKEDTEVILADKKNKGPRASLDPYFTPTPLTGRYLKQAKLDFSQTTFEPQIGLELTDEGGKLFAEITKRNIGKQLAIYLDGAPISAPVVQQEITGGKAQITGNFTPASAKELVGRLNAGALPVPIALISQQSVGASLGEESLANILHAGMAGFVIVALFMMLWYRLPGVVAVLGLLLYVAIILAVFKALPVTLTIAGIAGVILSIGMAVDANILIFERMKEELLSGKGLEDAIREGFGRAWTSIRDSNMSSLITAGVLYWLGTSIVKGFALTLGIGIVVSMFSAISVTRTLLLLIASQRFEKRRFWFLGGLAR